jgi:hypothetical protein
MLKLEFELSGVKITDIERELNRLQAELGTPGVLRSEAEKLGIDFTRAAYRRNWITIEPSGHGVDPATAGIIITLTAPFAKEGAKVANKVLMDLWTKVLFPRIEQRLGSDTILVPTSSKAKTQSEVKKTRVEQRPGVDTIHVPTKGKAKTQGKGKKVHR